MVTETDNPRRNSERTQTYLPAIQRLEESPARTRFRGKDVSYLWTETTLRITPRSNYPAEVMVQPSPDPKLKAGTSEHQQ